jgi:DNA-binding transcriptional ArsR family regulator
MLEPDSLARFAGLLADRSRAAICLALLEGRAWTVGELARIADIAPSTASEHVSLLVDAGLLATERQGRHRYVRLAGSEAAALVEDLAAVAGVRTRPQSLRAVRADTELAAGRTCYDHLAGRLGVWLLDGMLGAGFVDTRGGLAVSISGTRWLGGLGVPVTAAGRRPVVRTCLDWTERRPHLSGLVGARLCAALVTQRWVERGARARAMGLTASGREQLTAALDCPPPEPYG